MQSLPPEVLHAAVRLVDTAMRILETASAGVRAILSIRARLVMPLGPVMDPHLL